MEGKLPVGVLCNNVIDKNVDIKSNAICWLTLFVTIYEYDEDKFTNIS